MVSRKPNRFVSLHNHTGFSPYDGLGYPDEHFKYCLEQGIDAHAITEHGNMSSYAHAQLWIEDWNSKNPQQPLKYIPGVETYYHPDLEQWKRDKEEMKAARENRKIAKKLREKQEKLQTKIIAITDENDETVDIEMSNALTIEDEDETKSNKHFNPVNRRHHLVVLPKNQDGLRSIFGAVSRSYLDGFYRFPRMDHRILREAAKDGNIITSSACLGGLPAFHVFQLLQNYEFNNLDQSLMDDRLVLEKLVNAVGNSYDHMVDIVGQENHYLELQFNRLPAQNLVNRAIIEFAKRNGVTDKLIVTCDAHYARPEYWQERELYKKLGFMNYRDYNPDSLPKTREEMKYSLHPKNASQIWDEYLLSKEGTDFYDDELICDAIERTHDIAHQQIGELPPDRSPKFPKLNPPGTSSFQHLVNLCRKGMLERGLDQKPEYIARIKEELGVIKVMKNADYFISYQKIMELAKSVVITGPARGSGGGSLVNYVLHITDLDPIRWDLPFARFLSVYRQGAPDIDCVHADHLIMLADGSFKAAGTLKVGDAVLGGDNKPHSITATYLRKPRNEEVPLAILVCTDDGTYGSINVVPRHKFVLGDESIVYANELSPGDKLLATCQVTVVSIDEDFSQINADYVDATVEGDHRFHIVPFNVQEKFLDKLRIFKHTVSYS